jgi:hypothetical protein
MAISAPSVVAQAYTSADAAFLTGCWAGTMGSLDMREQWSDTEGGVLLGTTRYFQNGVLVDFEFAMIREEEGRLVFWPWPGGVRSPRGFALVHSGEELVFENLEHDFPVRIVYRPVGDDELAPRIEGRDGASRQWALRRADCVG